MEVPDQDEFVRMATIYIYKSVHLRGNSFQEMDDMDLLNTIGMAFGHEVIIPDTEEDKKEANEGRYFMFSNKAKKHITLVFDQIKKFSGPSVRLKFIPLALYREKKMYQIPLFCLVTRDGNKYVDDFGRVYRNVDNWKNKNVLPAGLLAYPNNLRMDNDMSIFFMNTPETSWKRKIWKMIDGIALTFGIASVIPGIIIPGGQIILLVVLIYGMGRNAYKLYDRKTHGQSISIQNSEARRLWLSIIASGLSIVSVGVLWKISLLASQGEEFSSIVYTLINVLNGSNLAFSAATVLNDTIYLLCNWNDIPLQQKFLVFAQMAFFTLSAFTFKTADQLITKFRQNTISDMAKKMSPKDVVKVMAIRVEKGDVQFLKDINSKAQSLGISPQMALECMINSPQCLLASNEVIPAGGTDIVGICLDTLTNYANDKLTYYIKNGNFLELRSIINNFPEMVLEYTRQVIDKIQLNSNAENYAKLFTSILGILFSSFTTAMATEETVREVNRQRETGNCFESLDSAFQQLDITDKTNVNERVWKEVLEKFNQQNATELYNTIQNFRALNSLVGSHPVRKNKTEDQLLQISKNLKIEDLLLIIEQGKILFGSEPAAIFHFITEGLASNQADLEKYIDDANDFISEDNFKRLEIKDGYRFCYYEREEPYGYAVVAEHRGYIRLCSYKFQPMDSLY